MPNSTPHVSREAALRFADEMETTMAEVDAGTRQAATLSVEAIAGLIQFVRDNATPVPPDRQARIAFYEKAMKDPKNHGGLALEMAFLRHKDDERGKASVASASA